jgi:hypothetical protein
MELHAIETPIRRVLTLADRRNGENEAPDLAYTMTLDHQRLAGGRLANYYDTA